MKRQRSILRAGLSLAGLLIIAVPAGAERVCQGLSEIAGVYGFTASRSGLVGSPLAFTGAFSGTAAQDNRAQTPAGLPAAAFNGVGGVVTGAATAEPFSRTGTLFADGSGGLFTDVPGTELAQKLGGYSVNDDCSVAVTLNNKFAFVGGNAPAATGSSAANALSGPSTVAFEGVILQRGEEVDLVQTGLPGGTFVTMRKIFASECTNENFNDSFGLVGAGSRAIVAGGPAFAAFGISGRLIADGQGNLITDGFSVSSPRQQQLSGTYRVKPDCTGSAQIAMADGTSVAIDFVLVHEYNAALGTASAQIRQKRMMFSVSGQGIAGSGFATAQ